MSADHSVSEEDAPDEVDLPLGRFQRAWQQFGTLGVAVLVALSVRSCVIEPYRIPSESMLPTLLIGDHLFVNKFAYGAKIPFTDVRLPALREPKRGDVVVFTIARGPQQRIIPADRAEGGLRESFVKRIIGLPGDLIEVRGTKLLIDGEPVAYVEADDPFLDQFQNELTVFREDLPGHPHRILDNPGESGPGGDRGVYQVEADRYFMMGDNRDHSNDSRGWGTVRLAEMKGPAFLIYWSWDWNGRWGELANPGLWWELLTEKMRWERMGDGIE